MYDKLGLIFLVAFLISMAVTPLAIKLAPLIGAMDVPKDARRMHTKAIPRFGGLAIFAGTIASMIIFMNFNDRVIGVVIGGTLIYLLGVIDDLKNLPPKLKLLGQVVVAIIMYMYDIRIEFLTNFFGEGKMDFAAPISFVITILWIVGITNAVNLVDGLDGLAAGISAIAALCLAYVAYIYGQYLSTAAMLALAGGALGYLPFNFYPAKIFMGDGGSLFLGFMLATLSVMGFTKSAAVIATSVPIFVLGLPIFDTFFAIFRRAVNKRPIMEADKGHLHHRLMQLGYGQRRATLMIYGISAIMGIAAVMFSRKLNVEGIGLVGIALMDIYIFLTDPNHVLPQIRQEREARQEVKEAERVEKNLELESEGESESETE
ncbi:MAG: undecaprenyl/decaprenyl-phosphate alpha-N-acetylglucosaminyl 1-phosphate transferase [Firmicutes bacterium]|nr:undecaprenyl/decaprenyl-phosphate alpha-N-acetylglucosaminyl 1-phosphate transferase [Bacillota bacterium]